jgi:hypothetical protein
MVPSKRARAVSAAGREIEQALALGNRTDVLSRWMAFRLAEVREAVEHATDPTARKAAQAEQDSLIIALWAKRSSLPVALGTDRRLGTAITLIEALLGKQDYWHRAPPCPREPQEIVEAMRDAMQSMVTSAAVLLHKKEVLTTGPENPDLPLRKNERVVRERLAQLASLVVRHVSATAGRSRTAPPSDEEAVALLEQDFKDEIDTLVDLLKAFRQGVIKTQPTTNDRTTSKRKAIPRKAPQPRKENKSKPV